MLKKLLCGILAALLCASLLFAGGCVREGLALDEESEFEAGDSADSAYDLTLFSKCG